MLSVSALPAYVLLLLAPGQPAHAAVRQVDVVVRGDAYACRDAIVTARVPGGLPTGDLVAVVAAERGSKSAASGSDRDLETRGAAAPCQVARQGDDAAVTFVIPSLPAGAVRTYRIEQAAGRVNGGVTVAVENGDISVAIDGAPFTRYQTHGGPNKPFFFPILTPDGHNFTRGWPVAPQPGETHDHPHHRGLWFTHGDVNGIDFWGEEAGAGKTVNLAWSDLSSGPVYGEFRAYTAWRGPNGNLVATDIRSVRVYRLPGGDRLMDFAVTVSPGAAPLVFGDTKEGSFGLRVADSLALTAHDGAAITTSSGVDGKKAWGKPNDWVDFSGPIAGSTYGIAIFDDARNLRHPEPWHARDYGLFAANPFALHAFGLGPEHAGNYTVPIGGELTLRYRLLFHQGDAAAAGVAEQYAAFADPPAVSVQVRR